MIVSTALCLPSSFNISPVCTSILFSLLSSPVPLISKKPFLNFVNIYLIACRCHRAGPRPLPVSVRPRLPSLSPPPTAADAPGRSSPSATALAILLPCELLLSRRPHRPAASRAFAVAPFSVWDRSRWRRRQQCSSRKLGDHGALPPCPKSCQKMTKTWEIYWQKNVQLGLVHIDLMQRMIKSTCII